MIVATLEIYVWIYSNKNTFEYMNKTENMKERKKCVSHLNVVQMHFEFQILVSSCTGNKSSIKTCNERIKIRLWCEAIFFILSSLFIRIISSSLHCCWFFLWLFYHPVYFSWNIIFSAFLFLKCLLRSIFIKLFLRFQIHTP